MRTVIKKVFWIWEFDKEEKWLNEMAAKGFALVAVGFCRYEFERCEPGEYSHRLELLDNKPSHPESAQYIEFLESTGAEHVGSYLNWIYLRKKKEYGEFEIFSDLQSRINHLSRMIKLLATIAALNLFPGLYNIILYFLIGEPVSLLGLLNMAIVVFLAFGGSKLWKKREALKKEKLLFE
jgi:hypothetical protein